MSYHDLSECTLDPDERREEANRICRRLDEVLTLMTKEERVFVIGVGSRVVPISVKQLFYLRDLNLKY